jgi:hypothetical protein
MKAESKSKVVIILLTFTLMVSKILWSQKIENPTPKKICQDFKELISGVPVARGATIAERKNHSLDAGFVSRSASLIQDSIGGSLSFKLFYHLPFQVIVSDRKVEANLFVFSFENESKLKKYLEHLPKGTLGKRGVLKAKAPQQFMLVTKGTNLIVIVIDGVRVDEIVDELFKRVGSF